MPSHSIPISLKKISLLYRVRKIKQLKSTPAKDLDVPQFSLPVLLDTDNEKKLPV